MPACPIPEALPHLPQVSPGQTLDWRAIPDCPAGSTGTSRPFASLRAKGRSASGRVPPMDYLDNPERRSPGRISDDASANSYGFGAASTLRALGLPCIDSDIAPRRKPSAPPVDAIFPLWGGADSLFQHRGIEHSTALGSDPSRTLHKVPRVGGAIYAIEDKARLAPAAERVEHRRETAAILHGFFD